MPFDPPTFEAEAALHLFTTDQLPAKALEAVKAGYLGPRVLRMAILDPASPWEIEQALPPMLAELGCRSLTLDEAALNLARIRATNILANNEDPLPTWSYFQTLYYAADTPTELSGLAYALDECDYLDIPVEQQHAMALEALEEFLSPALREQRTAERQKAWTLSQEEIRKEWPFKFDSPTRRSIMHARLKERAIDSKPFLILLPLSWAISAWGLGTWKVIPFGMATVPVIAGLAYWAEYRRMKRERRDILLRSSIPEDQI